MRKLCKYQGRDQFRVLVLRLLSMHRNQVFRRLSSRLADIADEVADEVAERVDPGKDIRKITILFPTPFLKFIVIVADGSGGWLLFAITVGPFPEM